MQMETPVLMDMSTEIVPKKEPVLDSVRFGVRLGVSAAFNCSSMGLAYVLCQYRESAEQVETDCTS